MPLDTAAPVVANRALSPDYNVLTIAAPAIAASAEPGQFVMVKTGRSHDPLLRRPFSFFEVHRSGDPRFSLLNKRVGPSTARLYAAAEGEVIQVLGPLGRPFALVDPPASAWMVAGGVGLAPFATLAEALARRHVTTTLFYGARTAGELFYLEFFDRLGVELVLATEDGSRGDHGRITGPFERRLAERASDAPLSVYACGPEGMLAAAARASAAHGRECQVSVERIMGCGLGGCYSCVVPIRRGSSTHHVRACLDGPVLDGNTIAWT